MLGILTKASSQGAQHLFIKFLKKIEKRKKKVELTTFNAVWIELMIRECLELPI